MNLPVPPQTPPDAQAPCALAYSSAVRTEDAVRYVERYYRNREPADGKGIRTPTMWAWKALTGSGGIAAATSNGKPGQGTVTLGYFNTSTGQWVATDPAITVPALNPSAAAAVTANWWVTIVWVGGQWEVDMDPC